jgi:hypothetical protein
MMDNNSQLFDVLARTEFRAKQYAMMLTWLRFWADLMEKRF